MVLAALIGLALGFYKSILGFFAWGLAFVATFFLSSLISNALIGIDAIGGFLYGPMIYGNIHYFLGGIPLADGGIINAMLYPLASNVSEATLVAGGYVSAADANLALMIFGLFNGIVAFLLFGLIRLILIPVVHALKKVRRKEGKKQRVRGVSRFFGFLVGGGKGLIWAITIFMFLGFIAPVVPPVQAQLDNGFMSGHIFSAVAVVQTRFLGSRNQINGTLERILPHVRETIGDYDGSTDTDPGDGTGSYTPADTTPNVTLNEIEQAFDAVGFFVITNEFTDGEYEGLEAGALEGVVVLVAMNMATGESFTLYKFPSMQAITPEIIQAMEDYAEEFDLVLYRQGRMLWFGTADALDIFNDLIDPPAVIVPEPDCTYCDDEGCFECEPPVDTCLCSDCVCSDCNNVCDNEPQPDCTYCDDDGCPECEPVVTPPVDCTYCDDDGCPECDPVVVPTPQERLEELLADINGVVIIVHGTNRPSDFEDQVLALQADINAINDLIADYSLTLTSGQQLTLLHAISQTIDYRTATVQEFTNQINAIRAVGIEHEAAVRQLVGDIVNRMLLQIQHLNLQDPVENLVQMLSVFEAIEIAVLGLSEYYLRNHYMINYDGLYDLRNQVALLS